MCSSMQSLGVTCSVATYISGHMYPKPYSGSGCRLILEAFACTSGHRIRGARSRQGTPFRPLEYAQPFQITTFGAVDALLLLPQFRPPIDVLFFEERTHRDVVWQSFPPRDKCYNSVGQRLAADLFFSAALLQAHPTTQINVLLPSNLERLAN